MPRARGGSRSGTPGTAYGNRSDLNASMPIQTATNQAYGVATEQRAAQQAIPVAAQPVQGAIPNMGPQPASAPAAPAAAVQAPAFEQMPMAPQIAPGDIDFYGETQQPDVPVTSGAPIGPGPGPEALGAPAQSSLADTLRFVSQMPGADPYLLDLAHAAAILGY